MLIANPIYDVVFKRLMENDKVAKFFISTLLEQNVESIEFKPQEFTYKADPASLAVFRLDFIATIKTDSGEYKKILIEIQKAKNSIDIMRFRNYLAEQYKKEDTINNEQVILPIITIFILGFKIPEIETACLKVERNYKDQINKTILNSKSDFIEKLTHDSYIVQVERITDAFQSRLDQLLSLFEQTNFIDDRKIVKDYKHKSNIEEINLMTNILHHSGTDPEEKTRIEAEQEAWRSYYATFANERNLLINKLKEKDQALVEKDKALAESQKLIEELKKKLNEKS
jgi:hypothetical protein